MFEPEKHLKDYLCAVHEAGHAVVALHYRMKIRYATLRPRDKNLGGIVHYYPRMGRKALWPYSNHRHIQILFAGVQAETIYLNSLGYDVNDKTIQDYLAISCYNDTLDFAEILDINEISEVTESEEIIDSAVKKSLKILYEHHELMVKIATGLLEHRTLDGKRLKEIFNKHVKG